MQNVIQLAFFAFCFHQISWSIFSSSIIIFITPIYKSYLNSIYTNIKCKQILEEKPNLFVTTFSLTSSQYLFLFLTFKLYNISVKLILFLSLKYLLILYSVVLALDTPLKYSHITNDLLMAKTSDFIYPIQTTFTVVYSLFQPLYFLASPETTFQSSYFSAYLSISLVDFSSYVYSLYINVFNFSFLVLFFPLYIPFLSHHIYAYDFNSHLYANNLQTITNKL